MLTAALFTLLGLAAAAPKPQLDGVILPPADESRFTLYNMPTPFAGPCDLETGPDGQIWVSDQLTTKLASINTHTGEVQEYDIPWTMDPLPENPLSDIAGGRLALACVVRTGSDGKLYAANGIRNQLVQMDVHTKEIRVLDPPGIGPLGNLQPFNDLYTGPHGMYLTQTTGNVLTYYEYSTGRFTNYDIPTPASIPVGVFYSPTDNNVYIAELIGNKVAKFDPRTEQITEYDVPVPLQGPAVTRCETDGRYVWFTGLTGNSLISYDMQTDEVDVFFNPTPLSFPTENTVDPNGNVWISNFLQNTITYFTPRTEQWTRITLPDALVAVPIGFPPGPNVAAHYDAATNSIWFTQEVYNRVGRYQLDGTEGLGH